MIWSVDNVQWLYSLALAMPLALLIDQLFGEPPPSLHPVVWMGRLLDWMGQKKPKRLVSHSFIAGTLGWWLGALLSMMLASILQFALIYMLITIGNIILTGICLALLLKPMLSLRLLLEEGLAVETGLEQSLIEGRRQTARICSRDTGSLDATALRETAVESLSENFVDSVLAPLFWFAMAGLPGAAVYRWANVADAMWGYRNAEYEWFGKFAARCDDVLNWLPARLSALALWPVGHVRQLSLEAGKTPSPNGGWPMAATALILDIRLSKPGIYVLNVEGQTVSNNDIARTAKLINQAAWYSVFALMLLVGLSALVIASPIS